MSDQKYACNQSSALRFDHEEISKNESRTLWVVTLTAIMMIVEIIAGYWTGSMALLADGYHMASHAGALGISYLVYRLAKSSKIRARLTFGTGKLLPLGGYTSCIGLGIIAVWMAYECVARLVEPVSINFTEAIVIAVMGLLVNVLSIWILESHSGHHHHEDHHEHGDHDHHHHHVHDHNHRSAVLHVMADALTSLTAIIALVFGKYFGAHWLDPVMGLVGSLVILRWAYQLARVTVRELLDAHSDFNIETIRADLRKQNIDLLDFHSWKIGPNNFSVQMIVQGESEKDHSYFRSLFHGTSGQVHLVVEKR